MRTHQLSKRAEVPKELPLTGEAGRGDRADDARRQDGEPLRFLPAAVSRPFLWVGEPSRAALSAPPELHVRLCQLARSACKEQAGMSSWGSRARAPLWGPEEPAVAVGALPARVAALAAERRVPVRRDRVWVGLEAAAGRRRQPAAPPGTAHQLLRFSLGTSLKQSTS